MTIRHKLTVISIIILSGMMGVEFNTALAAENTSAVASASGEKKLKLQAAGEVVKIEGKVTAIGVDKKERVLTDKSPIYPLDTIVTSDKSYAGLRFTDGTLAAVRPNTTFEIAVYRFAAKGQPAKKAIADHFKIKLGNGGMLINGGLISRNAPNDFQVATPLGDFALTDSKKSPQANVNYTADSGLALNGKGTVTNKKGKKLKLNKSSSVVMTANDLIPRIVDVMPTVFTDTAGVYLTSIVTTEIATYGEAVSFESSYYEEASVSESAYEEAMEASSSYEESAASESEASSSDAAAVEESAQEDSSAAEADDNASQDAAADDSGDDNADADSGGAGDDNAASDDSGEDDSAASDDSGGGEDDSGASDDGGGDSGGGEE